jgi:hypothetical protein
VNCGFCLIGSDMERRSELHQVLKQNLEERRNSGFGCVTVDFNMFF